jgi:diguanylate cyclase (GGDEF)-like protein
MPTLFALAPMIDALGLIGPVNSRIAAELCALAAVDTPTGARTRRSFIDEARRILSTRTPGDPSPALLMRDLDGFEQVNDRHGHASGDRVRAQFAQLLRDASPHDAVIGRYGGEAFRLLLHTATCEAGRAHAQCLCDAVRGTGFGLDRPDPAITVPIGLAGSPDGSTLEVLLRAADRRLCLAKAAGRDRAVGVDRMPGASRSAATASAPRPASMPTSRPTAGPACGASTPAPVTCRRRRAAPG